jgi:hypothetical protein
LIPFSTRYMGSMAVICALGLAPVAIHSYGKLEIDDCARPDQLASRRDWERLPERRRERLRLLLGAFSAREGSIPGEPGEPNLEFSIVRSWDPKRLYYRPDHEIVETFLPTGRELEQLESGPDALPIHVPIYPENAAIHAAYLLVYDGVAMRDPVLEQMVRSPRMMFRGARPITLYFARVQRAGAPDEARRRVRAWLAEAWERHRSVCDPSADRRTVSLRAVLR